MKYLVQLKPVEPFFFGGEQTFGKDDTRKEGSRYSAKSTYFPQQTALLGMLRKTLLIQNGNMTMHKKGEWVDSKGGRKGNDSNYANAIKLVGKDAFSYEKSNDLGEIKMLSPLFLTVDDAQYIVDAKDSPYEPKVLSNAKMIAAQEENVLVMKGFSAKNYVADRLVASSATVLSFDDVFKKVQTVGIKKSKDGESNEDGFFQKTSYMLNDNASFSFYLELEDEIKWNKAMVTLGADQSTFMMEVNETDDDFDTQFKNTISKKGLSRIVITSETLVSAEAYALCHFAFATRTAYRQLTSQKGEKSKRYYLFDRGSVLYTNNLEKLSALLSQTHLQQAGINHFIAIQGA